MKKLGFVGMGNMAQAMAKGFIDSGIIKGEDVFAYAPNQEKLKANAEKIGFIPCASLMKSSKVRILSSRLASLIR